MSLLTRFEQDLIAAQKQGQKTVVNTLRLLKADILKKSKDSGMVGKEMTDQLVLAVLKAAVKQRRESIAEYQAAGRPELVAGETAELAVLTQYLPAEMTADEIRRQAGPIIARMGPAAGFGPVMAAVMKELAGRADGALVNTIVKELFESS